jgi:RHS repeat-associated protein
VNNSLNYTYGTGSNRLFNIRGSASANYTYDANGNVRSDSHRGIGYIIYDPGNMPVQAYLTNGQQLVYDNDVNGNRVRNTIQGSNGGDNFYFNGADGKTEAVSLVAHGSNLIYNVLGAGGDNIGQVKVVSASPTRYYYLKDHLGSIKVTVDASGNAVGWDDYYPYGAQMNLRCQTASADGRYKFTGKERDASTGLDYFGARYYDQWRGGWDQADPMADSYIEWSPYNYALDNPLRNIDPSGKDPSDVAIYYLLQYLAQPGGELNPYQMSTVTSYAYYEDEPYSASGDVSRTVYKYKNRTETRANGTPSWRNNNPGNLEMTPLSKKNGAIGRAGKGGRWAVFPNYETGREAKIKLIESTYKNHTIATMMYKYAPPSENNTEKYIKVICDGLNTDRNRQISTLSENEVQNMASIMQQHEVYKIGNTTITYDNQ